MILNLCIVYFYFCTRDTFLYLFKATARYSPTTITHFCQCPPRKEKPESKYATEKKRNINVGLSSRTMHSLFSSLPFRSLNSSSAWEETLTSLATSPVGINSHTYGSWRWLPREAGGNGGAVWAQHLEEWFVPRAEPPSLHCWINPVAGH